MHKGIKGFVKGQVTNPGGSPVGAVSKERQIREAFFKQFSESDFVKWVADNQTDFYEMIIKLMPKDFNIHGGNEIVLTIKNGKENIQP